MPRIRGVATFLLMLAPSAAAWSLAEAGGARPEALQEHAADAFLSKRSQLSIDITAIGASISCAHGEGTGGFVGVGVGVGGDLVNYMVIAGRHFAQGPAYEPKDGYTDKLLFEIAHLGLFLRNQPSGLWQYDIGLRGSLFLHWDSSDDDPGGGDFLGGYGALYWGAPHFKVGPRVMIGRYRCHGGDSEFGINVSPITARILAAW